MRPMRQAREGAGVVCAELLMAGDAEALTSDVVEKFVGRKKPGLLSFLIDTNTNTIYPVPYDVEHFQLAAKICRVSTEDIDYDPQIASHIVTGFIEIQLTDDAYRVGRASIGHSSLEFRHRVQHTPQQLAKAKQLLEQFIKNGDVPHTDPLDVDIFTKRRFIIRG